METGEHVGTNAVMATHQSVRDSVLSLPVCRSVPSRPLRTVSSTEPRRLLHSYQYPWQLTDGTDRLYGNADWLMPLLQTQRNTVYHTPPCSIRGLTLERAYDP